ncbi:hypothetical protein GWK47_001366 [Chionoecetes opilio]|uniref:CCHC-type domain-containing protein n=1 Tax=Chionoecetes opilio TaxID=41210 RepID=A0A8J4XWP7_CHIOP|nr:hypothetical protein GWK47_001366 [Chionoecetes opilio]
MVRFARADGSKGSNKRQYEEPTPWTEMVSHLDHKDNNNKRKKNKEKVEKQTTKEKEESIGLGEQEQESRPQNAFQAATDTRAGEQEGDRLPAHPTQDSTHTNKKKKKEKQPAVPEYTINAEGKRVKVFRDGTQRTWFDLPYEESDTMTRYESMWVKKVMVAQLDRLKASLKEDDLDQKQIMKKMMKAKRKAHKELRIELIYQQKSLVSEATGGREKGEAVSRNKRKEKKHGEEKAKKKSKSKKVKLETETVAEIATEGNAGDDSAMTVTAQSHDKPKKKRKKRVELRPEPETSQPYSDKEDTTETPQEDKPRKKRKKGVEVRPETEASQPYSDKQHITEEQQGENNQSFTKETDKLLPEKELTEAQEGENNQSFTKETDKLLPEKELTEAQEGENNQSFTKETEELLPEEELTEAQEGKSNTSFTKETDNMYDNDSRNAVNPSTSHPTFEENDVMTRYEGYWVLREEVMTLEDAKAMEVNAIYAARTSETGDKETETENKELTQEEQFVLQRAMKKRKRYHHRRLVTRLSRKQLHGEGLSQQEVDALIQKERRKEERVLKNERKLVCLKCREPGHMVSACPTLALPQGETQPSICYTVSTEQTQGL